MSRVAGAGGYELTSREAEVLAAIERRLSNVEIAAEFYISVRTVETHIASLRRKLGVDSRAKLITAAQARRGAAVQVPQNTFVGREADLETVRALLDRERWVTVVGPAGCGKTRLALQLAAADVRVPVVAELEHATPDEVIGVVAKAIGLGVDSAADLVGACGVALRAQRYLLVLDNCDRVTDAVRDQVGRLLALAGSLTIIATSRSPVGGSDETLYQLSPLPVGEHAGTGAVRLFLDRAGAAAPTMQFSDADSELVAQICRRLDGLPLAIELAAARVRHLPLPELAARLEEGFGPLDRAAPSSRHRTLEAAFDWTWDLLDDDERSVLSRLAALPRTFDLDLAEAVTMPGADQVVLRLLDRSLLAPSAAASDPRRFRLLESLRAFVLVRTSPAIVQEVRRAHAAHHAALATRLRRRARTDDSRAAAEEAKRLCPEANAALHWAISHDFDLVLPLARALAVGAEQYGPDIDSLDAIARAARDPRVRATATPSDLLELGMALCYGDLDLVSDLATLALDRASDDSSELAARHLAGYVDAYRHRAADALTHLAVAERLADERHDLWDLASVRLGQGIALRDLGDHDAAMTAFGSAMQTFVLAGDAMHVNNSRYMMAAAAAAAGLHTEQAITWAEQCATYARASGNRHELAHARLTRAALSPGPGIESDLSEAMDTFRTVGDLRCLTRSYLQLAAQRPAAQQVPLLRQALDVARTAHDVDHQATALERLIRALWDSGARSDAGTALGELVNLVGYEAATSRCPDPMVAELDRWDTAIAEGRARLPPSRQPHRGVEPTDTSAV
ncbi:MAG: LuxR C-terminal-related transcriptional regulator [Actinomycetes bacterium]